MHVKIRQFHALDAVARLGSFAEAARTLHVTPAALSIVIRELEQALGFRVFERTTRRVRLSEAGKQYHPHVERVLVELNNAERCALDLRSGSTRLIRIATTQAVIMTLLPVMLRSFRQTQPEVRLYPIDIPGSQIAAAIEAGQADIAIGVQLPCDERFESLPLLFSRWHCFVENRHPLAGRNSATWQDIINEPLVLIGPTSRLKLQGALPEPMKMLNVYDVSTASAALAMAASGQGVAIAPGYLRPTAEALHLHAMPLTSPEVTHELMICIARQQLPGSAITQVRDVLAAQIPGAFAHLC